MTNKEKWAEGLLVKESDSKFYEGPSDGLKYFSSSDHANGHF